MSGGVDSSVAAALLVKDGYDVTGVFMKNWNPVLVGVDESILSNDACEWIADRRDALRVAAKLDIKLITLNLEKQYTEKVLDYFFSEYQAGRTPNPDVRCNKEIKFGVLWDYAEKNGYDFLATGHYALTRDGRLFKGIDEAKYESYFLVYFTRDQLKKAIFPIGKYKKPAIRQLAKTYGLPTSEKPDSQGLCFIGRISVADFLKAKIKPKSGEIRSIEGEVIGTHDGAWFYTIGQRHGLNIGGGRPYFVAGKDIASNIITVSTDERDLLTDKLELEQATSFSANNLTAQIRYHGEEIRLSIEGNKVTFEKPIKAVSPGQVVAFYDGDELIGCGIIKKALKLEESALLR